MEHFHHPSGIISCCPCRPLSGSWWWQMTLLALGGRLWSTHTFQQESKGSRWDLVCHSYFGTSLSIWSDMLVCLAERTLWLRRCHLFQVSHLESGISRQAGDGHLHKRQTCSYPHQPQQVRAVPFSDSCMKLRISLFIKMISRIFILTCFNRYKSFSYNYLFWLPIFPSSSHSQVVFSFL